MPSRIIAVLLAAAAAGATPPDDRLSLERAVDLALARNRDVVSAALEEQKAVHSVASARTRLLPATSLEVVGSSLLTDVEFRFPEAAFGTFPGVGPIPASDTTLRSDAGFNTFVSVSIMQPLTQLYAARLGVKLSEEALAAGGEGARGARAAVAAAVTRVYASIVATRESLAASEESAAALTEMERMVTDRVARGSALEADALEVRGRLAESWHQSASLRNAIASMSEQLNDLMGRPLSTPFDVEPLGEPPDPGVTLEEARAAALASSPDARRASIQVRQAELNRRIAFAERIPQLSVGYAFLSNLDLDVLPGNLSAVQIALSWEPLDWGRGGRETAGRALAAEQARQAEEKERARLLMEVSDAWRRLEEGRLQAEAAALNLIAAKERARVTRELHGKEAATLAEALQARAAVADASRRRLQALAGWWSAHADLARAMGRER